MNDAPEFFLPPTSHEGQEESFAYMANGLRRPVPPIGERVYSISFESDGILWKATVDERLKSRKPKLVKGKNVAGKIGGSMTLLWSLPSSRQFPTSWCSCLTFILILELKFSPRRP